MNSSGCFELIDPLETPKTPLQNLLNIYLDVGWIYQFTPSLYNEPTQDATRTTRNHRWGIGPKKDSPGSLSKESKIGKLDILSLGLVSIDDTTYGARQPAY